MAGSRRRFKQGKPKVRVGLVKKKTRKPEPITLPNSTQSLEWDEKATQSKNYETLGFAVDPNFKGGRNKHHSHGVLTRGAAAETAQGDEENAPAGSDEEPDDVREALGKKKRHGASKPLQRLTRMQRVYVGQLIAKYGDDFEAMSRDIKMNQMQQSAGALKLLYRRFQAYQKRPESNQ